MIRKLLVATVATSALTAGAAFADCDVRMNTVSTDRGDFFMDENPAYRQNEPILRDLRNAAMRLQSQGHEEACEEVVEAMEIAIDAMSAGEYEPLNRMEQTAEEIEARVVEFGREMTMNTSDLIGTNVYNYNQEFVGEIDGVLMSGGSPSHLIMGHGGFWNIGDAEVAIPMDKVRWDPEFGTFYIPYSEEQIEAAPDYDREMGQWVADPNDEYYRQLEN